jgi:hypothetical protein
MGVDMFLINLLPLKSRRKSEIPFFEPSGSKKAILGGTAFLLQGAESQNRTVDTAIFSRVLYQLS